MTPRTHATPERHGSTPGTSTTDTQNVVVDGLIQEILNLLDISSVGLYEFMWILHEHSDLTPDNKRAHAHTALDQLLTQPDIELVKLRWPHSTVLTVLTTDDLPVERWTDPGDDGLYIAIDRRETRHDPPCPAAPDRHSPERQSPAGKGGLTQTNSE